MLKSARLKQERAALVAKMEDVRGKARKNLATGREEGADAVAIAKIDDGFKASLKSFAAEIELLDADVADALASEAAERSAPAARHSAGVTEVAEGWEKDPARGYRSAKEFLVDVLGASRAGRPTPRLATLWNGASPFQATAGSDEHSVSNDPYGGFLVPKGLMPGVKMIKPDADPLKALTAKVDMGGLRTLKINARVDKDHTSSVSGGLAVYRKVEAGTVTAGRTKFEQVELQANELFGVSYGSEELLAQSSVAFASLLSMFMTDEFDAKVFEERLNGTGAGMYQGIKNSPALVTIAKETGQAADTIVFANVLKMIARCYGYGSAVWLANPTCYAQLRQMVQPGSTIPIFATGQPGIATLEGRPIFFHERLAAIGDLGDIALVNPNEYLESDDDTIQNAESIHVRFLEHERTFKFWKTNAGAGWWRTALTPKNGETISPFVYLAAR